MPLSNENAYLPLMCAELTEGLKLKAERELNETDEKVQQGLRDLKLLITEENLSVYREDAFLLAFLRVRKFRIDEAKESLRRYVATRRKYSQYFAHLDFSALEPIFKNNALGFLPYRDAEGAAILYFREDAMPPGKFNSDAVLNIGITALHFLLQYPASSISGFRIIGDVPMRHFSKYLPYMKLAITYFQLLPSFPARTKGFDLLNESLLTRILLNTVWPFLPTKIKQRFQPHGKNLKSLARRLDVAILPEEFGGSLGPLNNEFFMDEFRAFYHKMKYQNSPFDMQADGQSGRRKTSLNRIIKPDASNTASQLGDEKACLDFSKERQTF